MYFMLNSLHGQCQRCSIEMQLMRIENNDFLVRRILSVIFTKEYNIRECRKVAETLTIPQQWLSIRISGVGNCPWLFAVVIESPSSLFEDDVSFHHCYNVTGFPSDWSLDFPSWQEKKKKKEKVVQAASSCIVIPEKAKRKKERKKKGRKERGKKKIFCGLGVFFGNLFLLVVYSSWFCINTRLTLSLSLVYSVLD